MVLRSSLAFPPAKDGLVAGAAFLALVAALPPAAASAVIEVNGSNPGCSDAGPGLYCTIKAALARAAPGDTVKVKPGAYPEKVVIAKSGSGPNAQIILSGEKGATLTGQQYGVQISGAKWVTVEGLTIDGSTWEGVRCVLCANVTLRNNTVTNAGGRGVYVGDSSDVTLAGNVVLRSKSHGVYLYNSTGLEMSGGAVKESGVQAVGQTRYGIYLTGVSSSTISGVEVAHNSDTGVYLTGGTTGVTVRRIVAHHNARGFERIAAGIETRSAGNVLDGNIGYANEDSAINCRYGGSDTIVANNIAYGNGDHGIDVLESPRVTIIGNSVYKNVTAGINVEGNSTHATVMNNISVDNGINSPRTEGNIRVTSSSQPTAANYNLVWAPAGIRVYHWNGIYYRTLRYVTKDNPGIETNGIQADPAWSAPSNLDAAPSSGAFRLRLGSPAIDSADSGAVTAPQLHRDAEGRSRCDDGSTPNTGAGPKPYYDRGALEYAGGGCSS